MAGRALRQQKKAERAGDFGAVPHAEIPTQPIDAPAGELADVNVKSDLPTLADAAPPPPAPVKDAISQIVRGNSRYRIPPQGNETFDAFRVRALPMVRAAMQEVAHDPSKYVPIVLHSQAVKLIDAWIDAGMNDDFSVNPEVMRGNPVQGTVERLYPVKETPGWRKEAIPLDGSTPLPPPPGILLIQHGKSDENYAKTGKHQDAIAELAKHVKSGDFGRARAFAHKASTELGLSDDDIGSIIDSSLPSADEAAGLPHDRLLALASAAHGTDKFQGYADLLRERFGNLENLPPMAQEQLRSHLGALGV